MPEYRIYPGDENIMISIPLDVAKRIQNAYLPLAIVKMERVNASDIQVRAVRVFQAAIEAHARQDGKSRIGGNWRGPTGRRVGRPRIHPHGWRIKQGRLIKEGKHRPKDT